MRWTPENDQLIFLKLIETHDVSVKPQKIQEAWPRDGREIPTARAISERISKLRNTVETAPGGATSSSPRSSKQTTPRKRKNVQGNGEKSPSRSNDHLQGDAGKERGPGRERKRRPDTFPDFAKEALEGGNSTTFPQGFGIPGAERWRDEPFRRRDKAEKHNSGDGEGQEVGRNELRMN